MKQTDEFQEAVDLVRRCEGTVQCGCSMSDDDIWYGDALYVACKEYIKAYADRFPVWRGLP